MTDILERITPEMSEEKVLGVILDEIMARAEPGVAEAIRFCAIPHWFNEEIIAWLRGEGLEPSHRSGEILAALTELTFVGPYHERGWAYHENVRDLLLWRWRERGGEEFKELSGQAAGYFGRKLDEGKAPMARLFTAVQRFLGKAEALTEDERKEYRGEQMYHLLAADPEQGFGLFGSMFNRARNFYQLSTCALLLQLAAEQEAHLSADDQLWLRFCQGQLAHVSAQWPEALRIFEGLWKEELPTSLEGTLANDLGLLYQDKGEWDRAIEYHERSLAIKEKVGDEHGMATTFNNLGVVYRGRREWERAIEYYERSRAICEKVGDEHNMAITFNNLGLVYQVKGEWERAIEYLGRSLAIYEKVGDEHGMATTLNNLGSVYKAKGEWERAIEYLGRSLAIVEKVGDEHRMATIFNNLGELYRVRGEWEGAMKYYERSLAIREKVGDEYGVAYNYNNIALLYQDQGRLEEAIPLFEKSIAIVERIGDEYHAKQGRESLEKAKRELEAKTGQA